MKEQNYRRAREEAGIRPERAAAELGVSITTLFNWERGETKPNAQNIYDMANLYHTSANYLLNIG